MKEGKGIKLQHKAIMKADVNDVIGGVITGAILGASFSSAGEGLWQSIGW
ncbi:hypothetical protein [Riemerella columbina]|nr:hypothetical protein [Riemerella columbina]WKS94640.1 hypothetical protein NYR17_06805 [Riemerella columbina]